ncbi:GNAT family N-acetyltransferase [Streptomyces sp. SAS_281]|uniref:GNAT family N-acetyltransferase n=1 Tax=Streptomyces sp. SAS_281 TaxID=3412744 RepID=UPI00403D3CE1
MTVVPANQASWDDIATVLGDTDAGRCQCQRFKVAGYIWRDTTQQERMDALREQTACGRPDATATSGLLAYAGGEPVGWVAVEPRTAYPKLLTSRVVWAGRNEDRDDPGVWAVTCLAVRKGFRGRGLTYPLAAAAVSFAEKSGARALEAYPMESAPGRKVIWGELHVGARQVFEEAGMREVSSPTIRRRVMRIDF